MSCSVQKTEEDFQNLPTFPGYLEQSCKEIYTYTDVEMLLDDKEYQIITVRNNPNFKAFVCELKDYMLLRPPDCFCLKEMT